MALYLRVAFHLTNLSWKSYFIACRLRLLDPLVPMMKIAPTSSWKDMTTLVMVENLIVISQIALYC